MSNHRTDEYGGSLENRLRWPLKIVERARKAWGDKPLFYRLSASHWARPEPDADGHYAAWGLEQSIYLTRKLKDEGVDVSDVSSGGNDAEQKIDVKPGYQLELAAAIKRAVPDILVAGVGILVDGPQIERALASGEIDIAFAAREWIRNPKFALTVAGELGVAVAVAPQDELAHRRLVRPKTDHASLP